MQIHIQALLRVPTPHSVYSEPLRSCSSPDSASFVCIVVDFGRCGYWICRGRFHHSRAGQPATQQAHRSEAVCLLATPGAPSLTDLFSRTDVLLNTLILYTINTGTRARTPQYSFRCSLTVCRLVNRVRRLAFGTNLCAYGRCDTQGLWISCLSYS